MASIVFQEERWEELLSGKTFALSPRPAINHNIVAYNITSIFKRFLRGKYYAAFSDGVDVYLSEEDRVIPDAMIICNRDIIKPNGIHGVPDLIVEVVSPTTATSDKGYKKKLYEKSGVREYWIVDTYSRSIEVYLLKNDKFELDFVYSIYPDYLIEKMSDAEKEAIIYMFHTSLFADMAVHLEEVFEGMF